jgi:hypothetical protein
VVLASIAALSDFGAVGAWRTCSAFTATTGTTFSSGTVNITDDDAGSTLFSLTGLVLGDNWVQILSAGASAVGPR